nr:GYDIA family GHMP kinase [uncultured Carboxylicivirga sp.]
MKNNEKLIFHANGKLLLTAEYLVLKGAKALALPLNKGQKLTVHNQESGLSWKAYNPGGLWFEANFDDELNLMNDHQPSEALRLNDIINKAIKLNNSTINLLRGKSIKTELEFNNNWGWGSSSTLIALLSKWLKTDPYLLLSHTFGGSGYDIACALNNRPILYQTINDQTNVEKVDFDPEFKEHIFFIYRGQKQNSNQEVKRFTKDSVVNNFVIEEINEITDQMKSTKNLNEFGRLMHLHEDIISSFVQYKPINIEHFSDFKGYTKSLGAWGGDFFMAVTEHNEEYLRTYFQQKGHKTIFSYNQIVLNTKS